jgi:hypothetical protein
MFQERAWGEQSSGVASFGLRRCVFHSSKIRSIAFICITLDSFYSLGPIRSRWYHFGTKTHVFLAYFSRFSDVRTIESSELMERAMGIEPTSEAWEALNNNLKVIDLAALTVSKQGSNWKLDGN